MARTDPRVDAYIEKAQPFAQPILRKVRALFHKASAKIDEDVKWGVPSFEYKGLVGGMAAFKKHVAWGLHKSKLLDGVEQMRSDKASMMSGGNVTDIADMPPDAQIIALIKQAVKLNEDGVKLPQRSGKKKPPPKTPSELAAALKKNAKAAEVYAAFSPSKQRDYCEWITEAKQPETRARRLAQAVEWIAEGKSRNWKYERC